MYIFLLLFITWTIKVFAAISCPFLSTNIQDTLLLLFRSFLSTTLSTTATGGSASTLIEGVTISNLSFPSSFWDNNASFSHAINTSPIPFSTNVVVAPRAPESNTSTFYKFG